MTFRVNMFIVFILCLISLSAVAQKTKVMVMEIKDIIDPRMTRYVELALADANDINTDIVIIEMDTYGGILTDAKDIVDKLMSFKKPVWVFINADAASAGALISIACDSIYMAPGASIGAATVVDGSGEKAPDKYQSYMRSIMRATAEENKRNPTIAEGMVDEDVELDSVKKVGEVITFSTSEAIRYGYCEGRVESIEEILAKNNITDYDLTRFELSRADKIISIFLNPFISGILILIILGGIYFEMQTPGLGFAGLAALVALILYLVPYYLNGLAENWEIIAFFVGLGLIAVEIFVLPGFGVAGISGIIVVIGSLVLIMINNNTFDFEFVRMNDILAALAAASVGLLGSMILFFVAGSKLQDSKLFQKISLTETLDSAQGYTANFITEVLTGKKGVTQTVLRPSGKVEIDGVVYDAYTRGEYIDKGTFVEVINITGSSLLVKRLIENA
jgi:membrane-bound serine protease (ClpP class)